MEIVDTIPADTTFVSATPSPSSSSGDEYTWTIGDLGPGASGTIEITVTVDVGTPDQTLLHNVATLTTPMPTATTTHNSRITQMSR